MTYWGNNPHTLEAIGSVIFLIILSGVVIEFVQGRRARNLQAILAISADMRRRWEGGWEHLLRDKIPHLNLEERRSGDVGRDLRFILNWLDWIGLMVRKKYIDAEIVFGTLSSVVRETLRESADIIQSDIDNPDKGRDWWANVLFVAQHPQIDVNIAEEADSLRQRWSRLIEQTENVDGPQSLRPD